MADVAGYAEILAWVMTGMGCFTALVLTHALKGAIR